MAHLGGWRITVRDDSGVQRLLTVANGDLEEAKRLALAHAGRGMIVAEDKVSESEVVGLMMKANEVKEISRSHRNT